MLLEEIRDYILKYNHLPSQTAIQIAIENRTNLHEDEFKDSIKLLSELAADKDESNVDWLNDQTEKWCQERAIHNAILESIGILDNKNPRNNVGKGSIPKLLSDALAVSFDPNVGHDYLIDADKRFEFYHHVEHRIPFDLDYFNRITKGGFAKKTLNIILAGTNVGKSLFMCHFAAAAMIQNFNVLYITMEMAEEKIAQRIDANLLNVTLKDLVELPKETYESKIDALKKKVKGRLIVKEYPTAAAGTSHFRNLLNELWLKKQFKPDIVFVDYLNICTSSRIKPGNNVNSYTYVKAIAEELRGLAVEFNVPLVSATQTTRSGYCLDLNTIVEEKHKGFIKISDVKVNDQLLTLENSYNTVKKVFPILKKKTFIITTESGKQVICSKNHLFYTSNGIEKSLASGLKVGDILISKY